MYWFFFCVTQNDGQWDYIFYTLRFISQFPLNTTSIVDWWRFNLYWNNSRRMDHQTVDHLNAVLLSANGHLANRTATVNQTSQKIWWSWSSTVCRLRDKMVPVAYSGRTAVRLTRSLASASPACLAAYDGANHSIFLIICKVAEQIEYLTAYYSKWRGTCSK